MLSFSLLLALCSRLISASYGLYGCYTTCEPAPVSPKYQRSPRETRSTVVECDTQKLNKLELVTCVFFFFILAKVYYIFLFVVDFCLCTKVSRFLFVYSHYPGILVIFISSVSLDIHSFCLFFYTHINCLRLVQQIQHNRIVWLCMCVLLLRLFFC